MDTKGRASSGFGHVKTWSKRELCKGSPSLATTPSSHGSRFCHVTTWFKREPPKAPTNFTHALLNHVFSAPQHDPNLTPIKQETSGARPSQLRLTFEPRYNVVQMRAMHPSP
ncbi:hypothetical protein PIB30_104236 [Stylosanthes scabra]|uniref:Uncharacterized protein n=1 Tax=Stylosanthes scabra TaxID=79078 RepID=A0ABU6Z186_9FABA|nr:hypothetical protein [Stylosanthes scabra]